MQREPSTTSLSTANSDRGDRHAIKPMPMGVAAFVGAFSAGPENDPLRVRSFDDVVGRFGGFEDSPECAFALYQFFLNGGTSAFVVRTRPGAARLVGSPSTRTGLHALLDLNRFAFDLLCVPDAAHLDPASRRHVHRSAARLAQHRSALYIADLPADCTSISHALAWVHGQENPRSPNAAAYFPRLNVADPRAGDRPHHASPSGTIAGMISRNDARRGVWKAPAGIETQMKGVAPTVMLTDAHARAMSPLGLNAIRRLPGSGVVAWGARTLADGSADPDTSRYIGPRRLAMLVERCIHDGLSWVVMENNRPELWDEVRQVVSAFMAEMQQQGALASRGPEPGWYVRCGADTMTEDDRTRRILRVEVGFAPTRPGEFVVIRLELPTR